MTWRALPVQFAALLCIALATPGCTKNWRLVDPWGIRTGYDLVRDVQAEEAAEDTARIAEEMRARLCATADGRKAIADEAARSPSDDIVPCPEVPLD